MQPDELLERIETIRRELHQLIEQTEAIDEEILAKSRELDELMNRYHKMTDKRSKN